MALTIYMLAACFHLCVIYDSAEEGEQVNNLPALIAALLWPFDAIATIYQTIVDAINSNEPDK